LSVVALDRLFLVSLSLLQLMCCV